MTASLSIGVDVGGTKIAAGVVDTQGRIGQRLRRDSPAEDPDAMVSVIAETISELAYGRDVAAAGIGQFGQDIEKSQRGHDRPPKRRNHPPRLPKPKQLANTKRRTALTP